VDGLCTSQRRVGSWNCPTATCSLPSRTSATSRCCAAVTTNMRHGSDGIWQVPHQIGALRAGRPQQQKVDQVPPEDRKPVHGAYGAKLITKKGVFGIVQGHQTGVSP